MVWVVSIAILLIFIVIFAILRVTNRELCYEYYDNATFIDDLPNFIKSMPLPSKTSKIKQSKYKRGIKYYRFVLKNVKYQDCFSDFSENNHIINRMLSIDYSTIESLPSLKMSNTIQDNGECEARVIKMARYFLAHNDYEFCEDRLLSIINAHNARSTLSFSEIMTLKDAICYILLEKLYYLYSGLHCICKIFNLAKRYCKSPKSYSFDKKYMSLLKSKLFLSLCAISVGYLDTPYSKNFVDTIDRIYYSIEKVINSFARVVEYDFSRYYSPLEIYTKFSTFQNASECSKQNFLLLAKKLSDNENVDEFLYAVRVEKMMSYPQSINAKVYRKNVLNRLFCLTALKKDISLLCLALSSSHYMKMIFDVKNSSKNNKSIIKIFDFENTFEPIYKFKTINFGLSTRGNMLQIVPTLPAEVSSANLVLEHNGVKNNISIIKGDEQSLYLDNTKIGGTSNIKLSNNPLNITVVIKNDG